MEKKSSEKGFTLLELVVSLAILTFLISMILFEINPQYQYSKAFDGQRKQDLGQIRNALDTFYNDHNCYPSPQTPSDNPIPFGQEWMDGDNVLMKKVPQDPYVYQDNRGGYYYNYKAKIGEGACSQWNILFARLTDSSFANKTTNDKSCLGMIRKICGQIPVSPVYNYCIISGNLNCDELKAAGIPGPTSHQQGNIPTPTPTITIVNTPTPTPVGCIPIYSCRGGCNQVCNPLPDGTYDYATCIAAGAQYCTNTKINGLGCEGHCN